MQVITEAELLDRIRSFLLRHEMAPTTFGRNATGEPQLISSIEGGRSPSLKVVSKVVDFMARTDAEAATRAKLDAPLDPPPPGEEELALPFLRAPVNPTGASSPTCSPTSAPSTSPPVRNSSRCSTTAARSSSAAEESA